MEMNIWSIMGELSQKFESKSPSEGNFGLNVGTCPGSQVITVKFLEDKMRLSGEIFWTKNIVGLVRPNRESSGFKKLSVLQLGSNYLCMSK